MKLKLLLPAILFLSVAGRPARPQPAAKPLNKTQVMDLVKAGMDSAELAEKVKQAGIDFDLTDDYLQDLRKAGAKDVLINALRAARPKPLTREQVLALVAGQVPSERAAELVKQHGIDFVPDDNYLETLRVAGAEEVLLAALRDAAPRSAPPPKSGLSGEAVKHLNRGNAFREKRDAAGAASEYREAIRLKPDYAEAHNGLCDVLPNLGGQNIDAAFPECHEALRLRPDYPEAHKNLGDVFRAKRDFARAITEYREAIRLKPDYAEAHMNLGGNFQEQGDFDKAITEYRELICLKPDYADAHVGLGLALGHKGDWDGAVAELRESIRLEPDNAVAHRALGEALAWKGDWNGVIAESREAIRLKPDDALAHNDLGTALEYKGDRQAALDEYRKADELAPNNETIRGNYERLLKVLNE